MFAFKTTLEHQKQVRIIFGRIRKHPRDASHHAMHSTT
jgi:hypothetical protein